MSRFLGVDKLEIELVLEAEDCDVEDFCVKSLLALALRLTLLLVLKHITYIIYPKTQQAEAVFNKISGPRNKNYPGLISMLQGFQKCIA